MSSRNNNYWKLGLAILLFVTIVIILISLIKISITMQSLIVSNDRDLEQIIVGAHMRLEEAEIRIERLEKKNEELTQKLEEVRQKLEKWGIEVFEVTAYAPLCLSAIEGMCFSGDPSITASGETVIPGITAAAGRDIPFGTVIYIENIGQRTVQDRGSMITNYHLDIAVKTKKEALVFGRQELRVFIQRE